MVYKNANGQPRERCMIAAYSLYKDFGANQKDIAKVMNCAQSTVSSWIKDVTAQNAISNLTRELEDANEYVNELHEQLAHNNQNYIEYDDDDYIDVEDEDVEND